MKKSNGSLLAGRVLLDYCLNLAVMQRKKTRSRGLIYLFPVFAISLLTSTSPNSLSTTNLRAQTSHNSLNATTFRSEVCSSEQMISANNQAIQVEVPKFDANLGKLVGVELSLDCTTVADIEKMKVRGTEYQLALMIGLSIGLPNQVQKKFMAHGDYWKSAKDEAVQNNGFKDTFEQMNNFKEVITDNLAAFVGTGTHSLSVSADGLINFKNAESNLASKLKIKACLNYIYE